MKEGRISGVEFYRTEQVGGIQYHSYNIHVLVYDVLHVHLFIAPFWRMDC